MNIPFTPNIERMKILIAAVNFYELNLYDDNIKACLISVYMNDDIDESHLYFILLEAYRSQPTVFIGAISKTNEFRYYLEILNREIERATKGCGDEGILRKLLE
jgi:hypothetical protein